MNDLNQRLATLADEMTDTDYATLRQRVDTSARRLGYRRTAVTSVAALALAGAAAIGGIQLLPQANETPLPGESATVVVPPTPSTSTAPTPPPSSSPSPGGTQGAPAVTTPEHVPGRLSYVRVGGEIEVVTVTDGVTKTTSFGMRVLGDRAATISPDGTMLALIHPAKDLSEYPGDLVIVRPGGARKVVARNVTWGSGAEPVWMPDSRRLLVSITEMQGDTAVGESLGYVDTTSGKFTEAGIDRFPKYLSWSANGAFRAHAEGTTIVVARANGTVVRRFDVAGQPECDSSECPFAVQSISDDGRYVATAVGDQDPSWSAGATIVLDTTNGRRVAISASVKGVTEIFFREDNSLVVQTKDKLHLVARDGTVTATFDRPHATNVANLDWYTEH